MRINRTGSAKSVTTGLMASYSLFDLLCSTSDLSMHLSLQTLKRMWPEIGEPGYVGVFCLFVYHDTQFCKLSLMKLSSKIQFTSTVHYKQNPSFEVFNLITPPPPLT